ncbi:G-type lectin S-receptor-like serine/threonine-protein kinase At2g19130 [Eucalyptus grandis]|uniref:G-type lectin S-receptor-like serine/threonine-protein kinase At2g19130 n=1 Tax=Eucalyptus grandis TaxID=71139 RepID=UPI00192EFDF0|nr:G-type lectin S-receptor-like serine/threonine-protein kinase At2g19130 [Eucalyptus grandis]
MYQALLASGDLKSARIVLSKMPKDDPHVRLIIQESQTVYAKMSFDHPTDTWLPGAKVGFNILTSNKKVLVAWRNLHDPAPGMFSAFAGVEGRAQYSLYKRSEAYGNSGDWTGDEFRHQRSVMVETCTYAYTTNCLLWTDAKFVVEHSADDAISRDFHVRITALDSEETFLVVLSISLVAIKMRRPAYAVDDHLMHFEYRVLKKATNNFSEKIGEGGFSSVFRGALPDSTPIAVKKLMNQSQKRFQHLDWKTRYGTAIRIAKGLEYPHERCRDCILHYDIKPENMLLDSELEPQIADFCLAKLMGWEVSSVITTVRGARGYLAPEWISGGAITSKVDVLSYGKLLFEIISGKRNIEELNSDMRDYLPLQVANSLARGEEVLPLVDCRLNGQVEMEELCRACKVACWCIQDSERDRPTMSQIKRDVEMQGDFISSLIKEVERAKFTNIK